MQFTVHLTRDSVPPGDDLESHSAAIEADENITIGALLQQIQNTYLPGIAGGEATWIVTCSGVGPSPLGVVAQHWSEPRLRVPVGISALQVLGTGRASIMFEYWCQQNPDLVFERIASGNEPPSRW
jgi:hypothetical protein